MVPLKFMCSHPVRHAGHARALVLRADAIPAPHRRQRRGVHFLDQHLQAVVEHGLAEPCACAPQSSQYNREIRHGRVERHLQPAADRLLHEGEPADDRAGNRGPLGRDGPLRQDSRRAQGRQDATCCTTGRRTPTARSTSARAQQDPQGPGRQVAQHARLRRAVHPGLGLPRPADRTEGRSRARPEEAADEHGGLPPRLPRLRREVRRHPAPRLQAARHHRHRGTTRTRR